MVAFAGGRPVDATSRINAAAGMTTSPTTKDNARGVLISLVL